MTQPWKLPDPTPMSPGPAARASSSITAAASAGCSGRSADSAASIAPASMAGATRRVGSDASHAFAAPTAQSSAGSYGTLLTAALRQGVRDGLLAGHGSPLGASPVELLRRQGSSERGLGLLELLQLVGGHSPPPRSSSDAAAPRTVAARTDSPFAAVTAASPLSVHPR